MSSNGVCNTRVTIVCKICISFNDISFNDNCPVVSFEKQNDHCFKFFKKQTLAIPILTVGRHPVAEQEMIWEIRSQI